MSVVAFWRVQCSGTCGRWLADIVNGEVRMTSARSNALVFTSWAQADEAAAKTGMHDGYQGQFAVCDCGARAEAGLVPVERREKLEHKDTCRKTHPWLVPLCPRCRAQS